VSKSKDILLVEDNPDDERLTVRSLKKNNVANNIVVVRDGAQALDYLFATGKYANRDRSQIPAVMLLDLHLPNVDGLEVLRRVRADHQLKRLPIVILTSSNDEKDVVASYDLGANSYVHKPMDFEEFRERIRQLGLYWLILNENSVG
jgi:two-component system response regulator